jgi:SNF2 family DNA or RNA helicase
MAAAPQFRDKIAPVYYRRKREDVLNELPELIESREWCAMTPEEEEVYEEAVLSRRFADARRVSWNTPDLKDSSKANRLMEIVEEAKRSQRRVIVFSFFLDTVRRVCELLGERCMPPITGALTPARRQEIIDEFSRSPSGTVLPAQIQSGGTGLNIQAASVVIICEPQFKPSIENQAISRAYRMGQARNVLVYRLLCEETVDERITELLEQKQEIFDAFADESVAGKESLSLDDSGFGGIIEDEIRRINAKRGTPAPAPAKPAAGTAKPTTGTA